MCQLLTGKQIGHQRFRCSSGKSNGSLPYRLTVSVCDYVTDNTRTACTSQTGVWGHPHVMMQLNISSRSRHISDVISQHEYSSYCCICYFVFLGHFHCDQGSGSFIINEHCHLASETVSCCINFENLANYLGLMVFKIYSEAVCS